MSDIQALETLSGSISAKSTLSGSISAEETLIGSLSVVKEYEHYTGDYQVIPLTFNAQALATADKVMTDDITISQVPYWETSNSSNGMTAYIAKGV